MPKLNQIVAVEKGAKAKYNEAITGIYHAMQKPELFHGIARTWDPRDEESDVFPPESTRVTYTVPQLLEALTGQWSNLMDVEATKDYANMKASANVMIDDAILIHDAPVPFLIWLEKQLGDVHTLISKLPILDPGVAWHDDPASGCFASEPVQTTRSKKIPKAFVKYPATPEHPAQVEMFTEDEVIGTWTATKYSGALPRAVVDDMLERVTILQRAVKFAREEANGIAVDNQEIGEKVFGYLFENTTTFQRPLAQDRPGI